MATPTKLSDLLSELIERKDWEKKIRQHEVFRLWPRIVGKDIAMRTSPHVIRGTILWIKVTDSVWMQQLHLQKPLILDRINSQLKGAIISDLRFQVDSSLSWNEADNFSAEKKELPKESLEHKAFDEILAKTTDDEQVKQAVKKCWEKLGRLRAKKSS